MVTRQFSQSLIKKKCSYCKTRFSPNPRTKNRQKTCGKKECWKKHRALYFKAYRKINLIDELKNRKEKIKRRSSDYWKRWRVNRQPAPH